MKTKAEIVQALLNDGKITAEEAVILLTNDKENIRYIFYPSAPLYPIWPYNPFPGYPVYVSNIGDTVSDYVIQTSN